MFSSSFKPLSTLRPADRVALAPIEARHPVSLRSPATEAMTDFRRLQPVTVMPETYYLDANESMITHGVRLLLVMDKERQLLGVITAQDILGERPLQLASQGKGLPRELTVADLMHPLGDIDMLDITDVRHANVGDLVATLKHLGRQHLLVIAKDVASGGTLLCGLFSATQIARQLGTEDIQPFEVARTFAQIEAALVH